MTSDLSALVRVLHGAKYTLEEQLNAAQVLSDDLYSSSQPHLPELIRAHFTGSLLEWLLKAVGRPVKSTAFQDGDDVLGPQPLDSTLKLWKILSEVLRSPIIPADQQLPASLLSTTVALLRQLGEALSSRDYATVSIVKQVETVIETLSTKFSASFKPPMDLTVALAEAALERYSSSDDGKKFAFMAVDLLFRQLQLHPNPRKAWEAVFPRLAVPLISVGFQRGAPVIYYNVDGTEEYEASKSPEKACKMVLQAVVFAQAHVPALAEAAAGVAAKNGSTGGGNRVYAGQLFATVQALLETVREEERKDGGRGDSTPVLRALPWLVGRYCAALGVHHRAAEVAATISGQQQDAGTASGEGASGSSQGGVPRDGDFKVFAAFSAQLLRALEAAADRSASGVWRYDPEASTTVASLLRALAQVCGALKSCNIYRPTEDPQGAHRGWLATLVAVTCSMGAAAVRADAEEVDAAVAGASLEALEAILAVEHRGVQSHLPTLWPILWSHSTAAVARGDIPAHIRVACSLVQAYSELRQLEVLLASLAEALSGLDDAGSQAADALIHSSGFSRVFSAAVRAVPSGQVAPLVRMVAAWVPKLSAHPSSCSVLAGLGKQCLASLILDVTTAPAAAAAAEVLVAALAGPLLAALQRVVSDGHTQSHHGVAQLTTAALTLFNSSASLHATCCLLHPQVQPLPGHAVRPSAGAGTHPGGYFDSLFPGGSDQQMKSLHWPSQGCKAVWQLAAENSAAPPSLQEEVLVAAAQRLYTLHHWRLHIQHACGSGSSDGNSSAAEDAVSASSVGAEAQFVARLLLKRAAGQGYSSPLNLLSANRGSAMWEAAEASLAEDDLVDAAGVLLDLDVGHPSTSRLAAVMPSAVALRVARCLRESLEETSDGEPLMKKAKTSTGGGGATMSASKGGVEEALIKCLEKAAKGRLGVDKLGRALKQATDALLAPPPPPPRRYMPFKRASHGMAEGKSASAMDKLKHMFCSLAEPFSPLAAVSSEGAAAMLCCGLFAPFFLKASSSAMDAKAAAHALSFAASSAAAAACPTALACEAIPDFLAAVIADSLRGQDWNCPEAGFLNAVQAAMRAHTSAIFVSKDEVAGRALQLWMTKAASQAKESMPHAALVEAGIAAIAAALGVPLPGIPAVACSGNGSASPFEPPGSLNPAQERLGVDIVAGVESMLPSFLEAAPVLTVVEGGSSSSLPLADIAAARLGMVSACAGAIVAIRCAAPPSVLDALPSSSTVLQRSPEDCRRAAQAMSTWLRLLEKDERLCLSSEEEAAVARILGYFEAICSATGLAKPAATPEHYISLVCMLLHVLSMLQLNFDVDPVRRTTPLVAVFPAVPVARKGGMAPGLQLPRACALRALRVLLEGSTSQQLREVLAFLDTVLTAPPGGGIEEAYRLPCAELALMALEGCGSKSSVVTLGQRSERLAAALTQCIVQIACPLVKGHKSSSATFQDLVAAVAAAAGAEKPQLTREPVKWTLRRPAGPRIEDELLLTVATSLRALESIIARPKAFPLSGQHIARIIQAVEALCGAQSCLSSLHSIDQVAAAAFANCCHLLTASMRHRADALGRCMPLLGQALRRLLAVLVGWEKEAFGRHPPYGAAEHCAEVLAGTMADFAGLKAASKYCPHVLADYLVLAAAPPTPLALELMGYPAASSNKREGGSGGSSRRSAGLVCSAGVLAALRQGAFALYGACGPAGVQYVYASLGSRGGGGLWRAALATLKADHDKTFKYTGKV